MSRPLNALRSRYERLAIPTIRVAFVLSFILHAIALSGWLPKVRFLPAEDPEHAKPAPSLAVRLAPLPNIATAPPPAPAILAQPSPAPRPRPLMAPKQQATAPKSAPPILASERPSPSAAAPPAAAPRPPASDDLAAFIEARRRAREPAPASAPASAPSQPSPPAPPAETEQERNNRIAAANLGLNRTPSFGENKMRGGGIFQIQRIGFDSAEFVFFGWNKFVSRNTQQTVEVLRGNNPNIQTAVVRRMIAIIREHESGDFVWQSRRLGRDVSLSARASDNARLEDFMMREFFPEAAPRN
jgi:hypothetical protein